MSHKKVTVNKVVANSRNSVVTPEYLAQTINIELDKTKKIIRFTTQRIIRAAVHPIIIRYITDQLYLRSR